MKVMVTGATTPLGAAIVDVLLAAPDVELVLGIGREPGKRRADRLAYRAVDLTRVRPLRDLIRGEARALGIDAVVHAMHHRSAHDVGRRVHAQNVDAARELVIACADHPTIRRFVYRSYAEVYAPRRGTGDLIDEDAPLDFDPTAPQWVRDRVEADLGVCAHFGGRLEIAVLRCAEILAPDVGSQLWDYLSSRVCLHPFGFDPMLNVLSLDDAAVAFGVALHGRETGIFNIAGFDTLPLSRAITDSARINVGVPGSVMAPLYRLRRAVAGFEFRYDLNERRFHFGGVLDGRRARSAFGYAPRIGVRWPRPWWRRPIDDRQARAVPRIEPC
jgi:UDP-glucose 4-epimerase